jgi:hypothetical protein
MIREGLDQLMSDLEALYKDLHARVVDARDARRRVEIFEGHHGSGSVGCGSIQITSQLRRELA